MLFNEPKLLKLARLFWSAIEFGSFSALQRAEIAEIAAAALCQAALRRVSVLFNEPKLLKSARDERYMHDLVRFSALQRAEIAEIYQISVLVAYDR